MKIIFAGTPEIAAVSLEKILDLETHSIVGVLSQPDRPCGRGKKLEASAVKQLAVKRGIPVHCPEKIDAPTLDLIRDLNPDLIIVVAYGLLLPQAMLDLPRLGCWNIHYSLLPRWRGAAPVQRAIEAGDAQTGVAIMQMAKGLDTGDILLEKIEPIDPTDTAQTLGDRLAVIGAQALLEALELTAQAPLKPRVQDHTQKTYAHKLLKTEGLIDWRLPASQIERRVRAFQPWPVCYSDLEGITVRVWKAQVLPKRSQETPGTIVAVSSEGIEIATGDQVLCVLECQLPNKKNLPVKALLNAQNHPFKVGVVFGVRSEQPFA